MSNKGSGYTDKNFVKTREISRAECSLSGIKKKHREHKASCAFK